MKYFYKHLGPHRIILADILYDDDVVKRKMDEGLMTTYPTKYINMWIDRVFRNIDVQIKKYESSKQYLFKFHGDFDVIDELIRKMDLFGYYVSSDEWVTDNNNNDIRVMQFEPKFEDKVSLPSSEFLHVSPMKYKEKIMRIGLVPSHKNKFLNYPDRIYLFKSNASRKEFEELCQMLYDARGINGGDEYAVYEISIPDNSIKIYKDNNFDDDTVSFYVTENIPPSWIRYTGSIVVS